MLWESLAAGHNDAWMAALIVIAIGAFSWGAGRRAQGAGRRSASSGQLASNNGHPVILSSGHLVTSSLLAFLALTIGGLVKFLALLFGPVLLSASLRRLPPVLDPEAEAAWS